MSAGAGKSCPYADGYKESRQCTGLPACPQPVDCVGAWSGWSGCSKACGGGTQTASYTVTTEALNGGKVCPSKTGDTKSQNCNATSCCDPAVYTKGAWRDVRGADGKTVGPLNCDGKSGDGRPYVLQEMPITFPTNTNGPASITDCQLTGLTQYRYTGLGCADRDPTGGSCSSTSVTWDKTNGCTVTPATYTKDIGGTCSPSGNPWSSTGCTPSPAEIAPTAGTCSVTGVTWSSSSGCTISPTEKAPTRIDCNFGTYTAGGTCELSPSTLNPPGGSCTYGGAPQYNINSPYNPCPALSPASVNATSGTFPATFTGGTPISCSRAGCTGGPAIAYTNGRWVTGTGAVYDRNTTTNSCVSTRGGPSCTTSVSTAVETHNEQITGVSCPTGYTRTAGTNTITCSASPNSIASITCPANYSPNAAKTQCIANTGSVTNVVCDQTYNPDTTNRKCVAKAVSISDVTCPAGYTKDTATNKCKAVTGTVATVTGCPTAYNADTTNNRCTAKSATISSLTCGNTDQFKGNTGTNKCVAWA